MPKYLTEIQWRAKAHLIVLLEANIDSFFLEVYFASIKYLRFNFFASAIYFFESASATFCASIEYLSSPLDRKSTRLNSSHVRISYAVFCLKKKKKS